MNEIKKMNGLQKYSVLDRITIELDIKSNPFCFDTDQLFSLAARINPKRSFLFVSKILGKHLPVKPEIPLLTGHLLAMAYMSQVHGITNEYMEKIASSIKSGANLPEALKNVRNNPIKPLKPAAVIGFAETATALGHAFFMTFKDDLTFIHTTREEINELHSIIDFEEEHSHATSHRMYGEEAIFRSDDEVILVDDEITTGKTALNIIRTIHQNYPWKKVFSVVSILDWRNEEHQQAFRNVEQELGITIHEVSLLGGTVGAKGSISFTDEPSISITSQPANVSWYPLNFKGDKKKVTSLNGKRQIMKAPYLKHTGRFGLAIHEAAAFEKDLMDIGLELKHSRQSKYTRVIGTGEFMYVPMRIASYMGDGITFQSTTRSPIYPSESEDYCIRQKYSFSSPENPGIQNYLYQIEPGECEEIFVIAERTFSRDSMQELINELSKSAASSIKIIVINQMDEE
ncbi:phosphoribosyltransferase family protein [Bacillus sp. 1P06AnD]|uniref:phosphoribosyltransferase family protein n=1 Tax=Bacillus sp. 1P06AnD TaxID=3132208 RepID=UPI0039A33443